MTDATKEQYPDTHHDIYSKTVFGFWVYLMTDFIMFATLFAVYFVLQKSTFGGPAAEDLFDHIYTLIQTLLILGAAFFSGLGGMSAHRKEKNRTLFHFSMAFLFGVGFLIMQFGEYAHYHSLGFSWNQSAFLSAFYTLLGTHTLHVFFALLWIPVLLIDVLKEGIESRAIRRLTCLRMFWQFLNIVWVFIFSMVYLLGVIV